MAITVIQTSNWVDDVNLQKDGEYEVSTGTSFIIRFLRSPAVDSFTFAHLKLYDTDAEGYLDEPWLEIVPARDYSFMSKTLTLYMELPLETSKTYRFVITGLEDGAGNTMAQDYILEFDTAPTPSAVEFRLDEEPFTIEDHSLADPSSLAGETETAGDLSVEETDPPSGTMMVDPLTASSITITFSETLEDVSADEVTIEQRLIDDLWHPYTAVDSDTYTVSTSGDELTITFSLDATPVDQYLEYNYQYRVSLAASISSDGATPVTLGSIYRFTFATAFQPLYYDPQLIMARFPDLTEEEVYMAVYSASVNARRFAPDLPLEPDESGDLPYAAQEYVRCRTLFLLVSTHEEEMSRMELADLMIASDADWSDRLMDCMDRWQYELERYGDAGGGAKHFTKSFNRINMPDQETKTYTGSNVRPRNSWWD